MARIQGQIISPISSSVASMASRKVTEKLTEFGSDVMKSTRKLLGGEERQVDLGSYDRIGLAAGDDEIEEKEKHKGGLLDRLFGLTRSHCEAKPKQSHEDQPEEKKVVSELSDAELRRQAEPLKNSKKYIFTGNKFLDDKQKKLVQEYDRRFASEIEQKHVTATGLQIPAFTRMLVEKATKTNFSIIDNPVDLLQNNSQKLVGSGVVGKVNSQVTSQKLVNTEKSLIIKPRKINNITKSKPDMGEYRLTKGHHVYSKKAFENHVNYDPKKGFSISEDFMDSKGWRHEDMTTVQRKLYGELYKSTRPNILQEHTKIAVEALKKGGASTKEARDIVAQGLLQLRKDKIKAPTNIPWYNK
jgi:hypothetical protein